MSVFTAKINNGNALTAVVDGRVLTADSNHFNFAKLKEAFKANDAVEFVKLFDSVSDITERVSRKSSGKVTLVGEVIHYNGQPMHNEMTRRMLQILREGEDIGYLLKFIEKLMQNPSRRAVDELYKFLSNKNLPITEDGDFLAYKCVRENYLDKHSGKFDNAPGAVLEMERNAVDDNCNNTCSYGFHAGSLEYSGPQGHFWNNSDKVIIVKINPTDVVSIPSDYNAQKLRTCRYEVVADYKVPLSKSVYSGKGVNDEDYEDGEYSEELNNTEYTSTDNYLDTSDLEIGDIVSFTYTSHGVTKDRHMEVTEIDWDKDLATGKLVAPERGQGEYRSFVIDDMNDIELMN
jgi:hypothetical protein